jgi:predicted transposase YbfD/YdcC
MAGPYRAIGKVVRIRETPAKTTTETAYYLLSAALSPDRLYEVARQHWVVENRLHWRLDVVMNEDQDRTRLGNGRQKLAIMRHRALNAMQREGSKGSLRGKIKQAGWNDAFLSNYWRNFEMRLPRDHCGSLSDLKGAAGTLGNRRQSQIPVNHVCGLL